VLSVHLCLYARLITFHSQRSNLLNQARIATLKAQDDHIQVSSYSKECVHVCVCVCVCVRACVRVTGIFVWQRIMEETRVKLGDIRKNEGKYKEMLQGLLTQVTL